MNNSVSPGFRFSSFLYLFFTLFPTLFFSGFANAQSTPSEPEVSTDELVRRALQNNPQPAIARANLEAARRRAGALKSLPNPVLQITPGFSGSEEARDEEILVSQTLDLFGQRKSQRKVLDAQARVAAAESTLVTRALVIEVKNAAAELFAAQEAESLSQAQVEIAQAFLNAAKRRAELGDIPTVQAQRAELELLRARTELMNARAVRATRRAVLNQLIGQAPEAPLRVSSPLTDRVLPSPTATGVLPPVNEDATDLIFSQRGVLLSGLINRPDIVGAQATLEARRAQVDAIARQRLPQVELQLRRNAVFGEGDVAVRAVITAPIFDFGSIKTEKRAAQAEAEAQEAHIAFLKSQVASQIEQALILLEQRRATAEIYRTVIVPQTLELLRKTRIGFDAGASTYLEVLEAQRTLRSMQAEYLEALVGVRTSQVELESASGTTLPNTTSTSTTPTSTTPAENALTPDASEGGVH